MTAEADDGFTIWQAGAKVAPFVIVALAGMAVRTSLAATYPLAALLLFLWIVTDTMMLALLARSSGRPDRHAVLGILAGASFTVWIGVPPVIRETLWAEPVIVAGMAIMVLGHVAWATVRAKRALAAPGNGTKDRWIAAISEMLPPALVRLAAAELAVIHMALFRWGGPPDAPANCRAFSYHRHLTPMCATLLILSAIEIAVYHLLVGHWSRIAAGVMFVVSDIGFIYLIGFIKSFRFRPILLMPQGVRVRAGFLIDQFVPLEAIAGVESSFSFAGDKIRDPATLNAALLAWPNILLQLNRPMPRRSFLKRKEPFGRIAFRLDDPEPFVRLLRWRLGQQAR